MKYIFPGLGADSRMYSGPWRQMEDCRFIDWPRYEGEASFYDLARRLVRECGIHREDVLIGCSLGGMVSLEISEITGSQKVVLIGSAINNSELSAYSKILLRIAVRPVVRASRFLASFFESGVYRMYSESETDFIVAMSRALRNWDGFRGDRAKIARIHGKKDRMISCPPDAEIIADGGHLIFSTHARLCVDFILKHSH